MLMIGNAAARAPLGLVSLSEFIAARAKALRNRARATGFGSFNAMSRGAAVVAEHRERRLNSREEA